MIFYSCFFFISVQKSNPQLFVSYFFPFYATTFRQLSLNRGKFFSCNSYSGVKKKSFAIKEQKLLCFQSNSQKRWYSTESYTIRDKNFVFKLQNYLKLLHILYVTIKTLGQIISDRISSLSLGNGFNSLENASRRNQF